MPIDDVVAELGLGKVDFIKMDIEGAEKEALRGAVSVLTTFSPRVMIDTHQWEQDLDGLLGEVRRGGASYEPYCGLCQPSRDGSPHDPYTSHLGSWPSGVTVAPSLNEL